MAIKLSFILYRFFICMSTVSAIWLQESGTTCSWEGELGQLAKHEAVCQDSEVNALV